MPKIIYFNGKFNLLVAITGLALSDFISKVFDIFHPLQNKVII